MQVWTGRHSSVLFAICSALGWLRLVHISPGAQSKWASDRLKSALNRQQSKRQEALEIEQGKIATRQAEIAETQYRIFQEQLARSPYLELDCTWFSAAREDSDQVEPKPEVILQLTNTGKSSAHDVSVEIWLNVNINSETANGLPFAILQDGGAFSIKYDDDNNRHSYFKNVEGPVLADDTLHLLTVTTHVFPEGQPIILSWRAYSREGTFPEGPDPGALDISDYIQIPHRIRHSAR